MQRVASTCGFPNMRAVKNPKQYFLLGGLGYGDYNMVSRGY